MATVYQCSICGGNLVPLVRKPLPNVSTPHFYELPALLTNDEGRFYRSPERGLYLSVRVCEKCGHVDLFAAKLTGEIPPDTDKITYK